MSDEGLRYRGYHIGVFDVGGRRRWSAIGEMFETLEKAQEHIDADIGSTSQRQQSLPPDRRPWDRVILTTAPTVAGREVEREIDIVAAEAAFGMNVVRDFFVGVRDFVGGRSGATQNVLRDARRACLDELKQTAHEAGADAVIAVDLDYSEFSGVGRGSILFLVASGTAVKLTAEHPA